MATHGAGSTQQCRRLQRGNEQQGTIKAGRAAEGALDTYDANLNLRGCGGFGWKIGQDPSDRDSRKGALLAGRLLCRQQDGGAESGGK